MKRVLALAGILCLLFTVSVHSQVNITESPNVKIVIDGMIGSYEDVPLIVNDRTMLPLRAVLTNLGIPNDDDHIIWNGEDRSVTVITADEATTIWLQIDSYTAKVNGVDTILDVAPMIYASNSRTYIPARFVSETLGKKVAWDGSTTAVLIQDADRFQTIKDVLDKSQMAMEKAENYAMDLTSTIATKGTDDFAMTIGISLIENPGQPASYMKLAMDMDFGDQISEDTELDENMAGLMFMTALFNMEIYEMEDFTYSKTAFSGDGWTKTETKIAEEGDASVNLSVDEQTAILGTEDTVIAGLIMEEDTEAGTITLKGSVYLQDMASQSLDLGGSQMSEATAANYYLVYVLDSTTYEVISLTVDIEMTGPDENGVMTNVSSTTLLTMEVLEEGYELIVPDEVLENIVETPSLFGF